MSGINGVHALLAFLTQQAQSSKPLDRQNIDMKQLELLLQESRLLNERLLKIESLLAISKVTDNSGPGEDSEITQKIEGNWPAASMVRDIINRQERQQAFGNWQAEKMSDFASEPYSYREVDLEQQARIQATQVLIEKYAPNEIERSIANTGLYMGSVRNDLGHFPSNGNEVEEDRSRILLVAIGISLLLFAFFAMVN
jgi:hypothetical protein